MKLFTRLSAAISSFSLGAAAALAQGAAGGGGGGAGFGGGLPAIPGTPSATTTGEVRDAVIGIVVTILNLLALVAVIVIIIAGIRLIISGGEEEAKEGAKKTILYAVIGLLLILFSRVIVGFVVNLSATP